MATVSVLLHGTLIDGSGRDPVRDAAVVIEHGRVAYAGPRSAVTYPADATEIDVTGKTVIPGLIDCHDHLAHPGTDLSRRVGMPYSLVVYETAQNLETTLRAGITTVRDAGGLDYGAKLAVEQGVVPGPRLVVSLSILCPTAGLGDPCFLSGAAFPDAPGLPCGVRNGVDDCRKGVREMVQQGADAIKIATTGGISSPRQAALDRQFTAAEVDALVDEAHAWNRRVLCHAYGGPGAANAVRAGADSIDHGGYLHQDEEILREMADRGTFLVPTLFVTEAHRRRGNPSQKVKAEAVVEHYRRTLEAADRLGIRIAMGTDGGAYEHGANARELRLLVEAGLTPMQAIVASTGSAAACLGLDSDIGTLEPGKLADLVVVDGNPLTDIGILEQAGRLTFVMKGGVKVE